jgi:hypothetical protein
MHRKLRTIHLCTALFLSALLLAYGISAVQMAHQQWIPLTEHTTGETFALTPGLTDARLVARDLMDRHSMRGELTLVSPSSEALRFRVTRLGTVYEIAYSISSGGANVRTSTSGFMGVLNSIHRSKSLSHTYAPMISWTIMLGLVSIGLLTLGASGLYLWFRNHKERWIGAILLIIGAGIPAALIISMRIR